MLMCYSIHMKLRMLPKSMSLKGKRVLLRVDWNVPRTGQGSAEDSLKLTQGVETIREYVKRGAVVLVLTHWGRPKHREAHYSTRRLQRFVRSTYHLPLEFLGADLTIAKGLHAAQEKIQAAAPGTIFLLENVRFYPGEEKNDKKLARAYASLADIFVNDAFASCHRVHVSVVGAAALLPHYAGPHLASEVQALERLLKAPKHPFVVVIGGAKISTKIDVLRAFIALADRVCIGGAMAHAFFAAQKLNIGKSFVEKEGVRLAKKLLTSKKIYLPQDVLAAAELNAHGHPRATELKNLKKTECIGDIGPETMRVWSGIVKTAKTIVWNGPLGAAEFSPFSHGSLTIGRAIALRSQGKAYGVVGGGDTLPIMFASGMSEWIDHLSTGGGAMLEFIAKKGNLPGILTLR